MKRLKPILMYLALLVFALLIRLPYFFDSVINWDEGAFILMGQDILDGHLPYIHLWDLKPPFAFLWHALCLKIFGHSIVAVRIGALLAVVGAALIAAAAVRRLYTREAGYLTAFLYILFVSVFPSGQAAMTEVFNLLPTTILIFLVISPQPSKRSIFIAGMVSGIAFLTRLNAIYLVAIALPVFMTAGKREGVAKNALTFLAGLFLFPAAIAIIYFVCGQWSILVRSAVIAPLLYTAEKYQALPERIIKIGGMFVRSIMSQSLTLWGLFGAGTISLLVKDGGESRRRSIAIIFLLFLVTTFSIFHTGRAFPHYLVQLVPFMAVIAGIYLSSLFTTRRVIAALLFSVLVIPPLGPVVVKYERIISRAIVNRMNFFSDAGYMLAEHLKTRNVAGRYVAILQNHHIASWLAGAKMPTKYVCVANIGSAALLKAIDGDGASPAQELYSILAKEPIFIVLPDREWLYYLSEGEKEIIYSEIKKNYLIDADIKWALGSIYIYGRRADAVSAQPAE